MKRILVRRTIRACAALATALILFVSGCMQGGSEEQPSARRAARPLDTPPRLPQSPSEKSLYASMRDDMVRIQIEERGVSDAKVLDALRKVERHRFVADALEPYAYEDRPLPIGEDQTISQPYIVGLMTELLELEPGDKVLEIGTGSGYQAAVLAEIASEVYTIEIIETLGKQAERTLADLGYENVHVRVGDGFRGWPEQAPFDAIIVTASPEEVPQPLIDQLAQGGRLVIPVGPAHNQRLRVLERTPKGIERHNSIAVRFVPMTGEALDGSRER